jgi:predicted amidohydrolase
MKLKVASANYLLKRHQSYPEYEQHIKNIVKAAVDLNADLLLFPEYGSIELVSLMAESIQKNLALQLSEIQKYQEIFLNLYLELAKQYSVLIVAPSFPWKIENGEIRNRSYVFFPNGEYDFQEKTMMTRFENEEWKVSPGNKKLKVFKYKNTTFGINICYDIEFPDFAREQCQLGAQLILVPSCTESIKGMHRVHTGAKARALENQCYVVVSQTIGDVDYSEAIDKNTGKCAAYSTSDLGFPDDGVLLESDVNVPGWNIVELDFAKIENVRSHGNVFNFNDISKIK